MDVAGGERGPQGDRLEDHGESDYLFQIRRCTLTLYQAWVLVMFLAVDIDRGNLANATADNILKDLKLTQADYVRSCDVDALLIWAESREYGV